MIARAILPELLGEDGQPERIIAALESAAPLLILARSLYLYSLEDLFERHAFAFAGRQYLPSGFLCEQLHHARPLLPSNHFIAP